MHQAASGFRKNPHYRKGYENQSKFLISIHYLLFQSAE